MFSPCSALSHLWMVPLEAAAGMRVARVALLDQTRAAKGAVFMLEGELAVMVMREGAKRHRAMQRAVDKADRNY